MIAFGGRPVTTAQRLQERAGHFPQGLARADEFPPRGEAVRRARAAGRRASAARSCWRRSPAARRRRRCPCPSPTNAPSRSEERRRKSLPEPLKLPLPQIPLPEGLRKLFQPARQLHARNRQEALRGEAGIRQLLFQQAEPGPRLAGLVGQGRLRRARRPWTIAGSGQRRPEVRLRADRRRRGVEASRRRREVGSRTDARPRRCCPRGSGGLLPALYLWRRLALQGRSTSARSSTRALRRCAATTAWPTCWSARTRGSSAGSTSTRPGANCWPWKCIPARTPIPARSISPTIADVDGRLAARPHGSPRRRRVVRRVSTRAVHLCQGREEIG